MVGGAGGVEDEESALSVISTTLDSESNAGIGEG